MTNILFSRSHTPWIMLLGLWMLCHLPFAVWGDTPEAPMLSSPIELTNWGFSTPDEIRLGQVAVVREGTATYLEIHALYPSLPSPDAEYPGPVTGISRETVPITLASETRRATIPVRFGSFQQAPAQGTVVEQHGSLCLEYTKPRDRFCGLWVQTIETDANSLSFLNAQRHPYLSFFIRGSIDPKKCMVRVADKTWFSKDDAVSIGTLDSFLLAPTLPTEWSLAVVPLADLPISLQWEQVASLAFAMEGEGQGTLEIKNLTFSTLSPYQHDTTKTTPAQHAATWIWTTEDLLKDPAAEEELFRFLTRQGIDHAFLQVPRMLSQVAESRDPDQFQRLRQVLARFHAQGIQPYALDGSPSYALPENHPSVLRIIDAVGNYNREVQETERFVGIHMDIEPHALAGFGSTRRSFYFEQVLDLYQKMSEATHTYRLKLGVDIPFWYDSVDEISNKPNQISFKGQLKTVSQHITDIADYVVVMDYRTKVSGPGGIVDNAQEELVYASVSNKPVFVALETRPFPEQTLFRFQGPPIPGFPAIPLSQGFVVLNTGTPAQCILYPSAQPLPSGEITPSTAFWYWPIQSRVSIDPDTISFARLTYPHFKQTLAEAKNILRAYPSFQGFAIHDAQHFQALISSAKR